MPLLSIHRLTMASERRTHWDGRLCSWQEAGAAIRHHDTDLLEQLHPKP